MKFTRRLRAHEEITSHFQESRHPDGKARGGRIASYLTDEQRSHTGWIGASKCEVIFERALSIGLCLGLCLVLIGLMCGCTGKQKQKRAVELYNLHYAPPGPVTQSPLPFIISIERFKAVPPYNSTRIIYSKTDFMQNKYYYHQWIINPDEMLTHLMARDLRESNIARAILVSGNSFATHQLDGTVDEFFEQDHENQWNAVLSITITLTKKNEGDVTKRICFQKNYRALSPCEQKNPNGLARAMSMAMASISDMIIADIFTALQ